MVTNIEVAPGYHVCADIPGMGGRRFHYVMLAWSVFLAVLPLFLIENAEMTMVQGKMGRSIIWMIFYVLFFPNSVYMVTDFIHISSDKFM